MEKCKNCFIESARHLYKCPDCGAIFCDRCANKNKKICPYCFSNIDYN